MVCQKCGLTEASIHRESLNYRQVVQQHLCLVCAGIGGVPPLVESALAKIQAVNLGLPWRLVGQWEGEKKTIRFDDDGSKLLRSTITDLIARSSREILLSIHFRVLGRFGCYLTLAPRSEHSVRLSLQIPKLHYLARYKRGPDSEPEVRNRIDQFFRSIGDGPAYQDQSTAEDWKCDLRSETSAITEVCRRLFSEIFSLTPEAVLHIHLEEYFESDRK